MFGLILFWLIAAAVVAIIANSKGYDPGAWFIYGLLIWPIALVHVLTKPTDPSVADQQMTNAGGFKKCADCAELVRAEARKCRYCGRVFPEPAAPPAKASAPKLRSLDRFK